MIMTIDPLYQEAEKEYFDNYNYNPQKQYELKKLWQTTFMCIDVEPSLRQLITFLIMLKQGRLDEKNIQSDSELTAKNDRTIEENRRNDK